MGFQQRPQRRAPRCPWCDGEMAPDSDSRGGRLFCPNGEPVEYRLSGGRWYFNGRINGLDEPFPPSPNAQDAFEPADSSGPTGPSAPSDPSATDPLDAFRAIASAAWGTDAAAGGSDQDDADRA